MSIKMKYHDEHFKINLGIIFSVKALNESTFTFIHIYGQNTEKRKKVNKENIKIILLQELKQAPCFLNSKFTNFP